MKLVKKNNQIEYNLLLQTMEEKKVTMHLVLSQLLADTEAWEKAQANEYDGFIKTKWHKPGVGKFKFRVLPGSAVFGYLKGVQEMEKLRRQTHQMARHVAAAIRKRSPKDITGIRLKFQEDNWTAPTYANVFLRRGIYVAVQSHCDEDAGIRVWAPYPDLDEFICALSSNSDVDRHTLKKLCQAAIVELKRDEEDMDHMLPTHEYLKTLEEYCATLNE